MKNDYPTDDVYFAASNSKVGFYGYFDDCLDRPEIDRVYAVKGGPGTGKSHFMRQIAKEGVRRGYAVECILCSSDPNSLDGVILRGRGRALAFCDATSPHVYEPRHPGVREEIVNLGAFWDADLLAARREEIFALEEQKKAAYRRAYRYLSAAGEVFEDQLILVEPFVKRDLLERFAEKFARRINPGKEYTARPSLQAGLGMEGSVRLGSFFRLADTRFAVEDCYAASAFLFAEFGRVAMEKRARVRVSYDPLLPGRPDGILFCDERIALAPAEGKDPELPAKTIRMRHFVDVGGMHEARGKIRHAEALRRALLSTAEEAMGEVKAAHFSIEAIYGDAMDFSAKERFTKQFIKKLFDQ